MHACVYVCVRACVYVCVYVCVCVCVCVPSLLCMVGVIFVYVDMVFGLNGYSFLCLAGCFSMIIWTPAVLSVLYACVSYFCICTYSVQLSMFHMESALQVHSLLLLLSSMFPLNPVALSEHQGHSNWNQTVDF